MKKVDVISAAVEPRLRLNLVARVPIATGEVIFACSPSEIVRQRTWRTVQIDWNRYVRNEFLDYVDHSCEPNAVFDCARLSMIALRPIQPGEPVTFFYPGAEVELAQAFQCHCGAARCVGYLKGAFYLTADQMQFAIDAGYCTSFMAEQLKRLLGLPALV